MNIKTVWNFPVPSTALEGTKLIYPGGDAWLLFDYYDEQKDDIFNSGIVFEAVQAHKHLTEAFTESTMGAYDCLVEVTDSAWIKELKAINSEIANLWKIKHYAIYLKSSGLFEFAARGYEIMEVKKGNLQ